MPTYYPINEQAARTAQHMNSHTHYEPNSATNAYREAVDQMAGVAEKQKITVDPMYHDKIDALLEVFSKKLADNFNQRYAIECRCPSILISGGGNFPVNKKLKQNAARDKNMQEYREINSYEEKIKGIGTGGISADDKNAVAKLQAQLDMLQEEQQYMKAVNAYYRKHGTCVGMEGCSDDAARKADKVVENAYSWNKQPFPSYALTNNNANIRRIEQRIEALQKIAAAPEVSWTFNGGRVEQNKELNRLQIFFDQKPDNTKIAELKANGFKWAPSQGAWQRQMTPNALYAAKHVAPPLERIEAPDSPVKALPKSPER